METQVKAFYQTNKGFELFTIFGYVTKGVPSLEINGAGKLSKNIKEKLIFLTRNRKLAIPHRRFVICVDQNDQLQNDEQLLKWLEFPLLLTYWYLAGLIPIKKLENCVTSGWIRANGEIFHHSLSDYSRGQILKRIPPLERDQTLFIGGAESCIHSSMLLEHISGLSFKQSPQVENKIIYSMTS
ncbi:MAG: hypothetical protein CME65_15550 [Halobacteriovoraceae bacterium]|nr:hypothetical protein [Halobacteriovoraceae bacterium]|tara:strand:+ start:12260 stop:12811 length:552 start_codon:yes stop_codon:yes gene_type:complete